MIEILIKYWYIIIIGILLLYIYFKLSKKETVAGVEHESLYYYFLIGIIILGAIVINVMFFSQHYYLFISMIIFIPIWSYVIFKLLSRDDVYVIESTIAGDVFFDLKNGKKIIADNTSQRILIMPREIYDGKTHVGDLHYGFWAGSNRIKFCDKFDDDTGIFYHPPLQQLHNFSFYAIKSLWLKLKSDLPKIIDENTKLSLMSDWYIAFKMHEIKENMHEHLKSIKNQHENKPFTMPESLQELFEKSVKDKTRDISKSEKLESENKNIVDVKQ